MKFNVMVLAVLVALVGFGAVGCGEVTAEETVADGGADADSHVMQHEVGVGGAGGNSASGSAGASGAGGEAGAGGASGRALGAGCTADDQCSSQTCVIATSGMCCDSRPLDACSTCVGGYLTALKDGSLCGPGEGPPYSCQSGRCLPTS